MDHDTMAANYIVPLSNFPISMYGISPLDAYGITWRGVNATEAYSKSTQFNKQGIQYIKEDVEQAGSNYYLGYKGQSNAIEKVHSFINIWLLNFYLFWADI